MANLKKSKVVNNDNTKKLAIKSKIKIKAKVKAKTKSKTKGKMGRPKIVIDFTAVEKLAAIHCTQAEIAHFLGCSTDTLTRNSHFCEIYKKGLDMGKMSLRRSQWKLVDAGNCAMVIFLGKNILGQSDQPIDMSKKLIQDPVVIVLSTDNKPKVYRKPIEDDEKDSND